MSIKIELAKVNALRELQVKSGEEFRLLFGLMLTDIVPGQWGGCRPAGVISELRPQGGVFMVEL